MPNLTGKANGFYQNLNSQDFSFVKILHRGKYLAMCIIF